MNIRVLSPNFSNFKLKLVLALTGLFGLSFMSSTEARDGCPEGMMPYMQQYTDNANGQLRQMMTCIQDNSYAAETYAPPPPPDLYAAYATDPEHGKLFWSTFYRGANEAVVGAIDTCSKATGQACKSLGWFSNQCGALALTQDRRIFSGYDTNWRDAGRRAMDACNIEGQIPSICRLWVPPVCTGAQFGATANDYVANASDVEIEALSAELDRREYWGVVAASDTGDVETKVNMPSRESAEHVVTDDSVCKGCTVKLTYRDSCAGLAWPSDGRPLLVALLNENPQMAEADARGQCTAKYGGCVGATRCSGRRYQDGYPSGSPKLQENGAWMDVP